MPSETESVKVLLKSFDKDILNQVTALEWKTSVLRETAQQLKAALEAMSALRGQMAKPIEDPDVDRALRKTDAALNYASGILSNKSI